MKKRIFNIILSLLLVISLKFFCFLLCLVSGFVHTVDLILTVLDHFQNRAVQEFLADEQNQQEVAQSHQSGPEVYANKCFKLSHYCKLLSINVKGNYSANRIRNAISRE